MENKNNLRLMRVDEFMGDANGFEFMKNSACSGSKAVEFSLDCSYNPNIKYPHYIIKGIPGYLMSTRYAKMEFGDERSRAFYYYKNIFEFDKPQGHTPTRLVLEEVNPTNFFSSILLAGDMFSVEYGKFPQRKIKDKEIIDDLNSRFKLSLLMEQGTYYTNVVKDYDDKFSLAKSYMYKGKEVCKLKDNWYFVEPVTWYYNKSNNLLLTQNLISRTNGTPKELQLIYDSLFQEEKKVNEYAKFIEKSAGLNNSFALNFQNKKSIDIMKDYLDNKIPIYLHGKPGEGKTSRFKQLDNNLISLNLAKSDENFLGNYEENIKPKWYLDLLEKSNNKPDELHILLFEELSKATPEKQAKIESIILDRKVHDEWPLPDNCAVGGDGNDSLGNDAVHGLIPSLYSRMAHLEIITNIDEWVDWANENNINPLIKAYLLANPKDLHSNNNTFSELSDFKVCVDPRTWEKASQLLDSTNNPLILKGLLGDVITEKFCIFCLSDFFKLKDDFPNENELKKLKNSNHQYKLLTIAHLSMIGINDMDKTRAFVLSLGQEYLKVFDGFIGYNKNINQNNINEKQYVKRNISKND